MSSNYLFLTSYRLLGASAEHISSFYLSGTPSKKLSNILIYVYHYLSFLRVIECHAEATIIFNRIIERDIISPYLSLSCSMMSVTISLLMWLTFRSSTWNIIVHFDPSICLLTAHASYGFLLNLFRQWEMMISIKNSFSASTVP